MLAYSSRAFCREPAGLGKRATALLARSVQDQAYVLAFIDGFMVFGFAVIGALLLMLLLRTPPANSVF